MINPRPYKKPISLFDCLNRIQESVGSHFDPELAMNVVRILQLEKHNAERVSGKWIEPDKFSEDYIKFIRLIDVDKIRLDVYGNEQFFRLRNIVKEALAHCR